MGTRGSIVWDRLVVVAVLAVIVVLATIPTGFPGNDYANSERARVRVLEVDNSRVSVIARFVLQGTQICRVRVENGSFAGHEMDSVNNFIGKLEVDKLFRPGDQALAIVDVQDGKPLHITLIDHYRLATEGLLFLAFAVLLLVFARWTGIKALLSFVLCVLTIWKVLVPAFLKGYSPVPVALGVVIFLTVAVIVLVTGVTRKSLIAILGSLAGSTLTCILALVFGGLFRLHGAIMPWAESLLYAGYADLQLTQIFLAGVFIASSGALMDLAMDISSAVHELVLKNPSITPREATQSGFRIGQAVIGTMTTTLLLAYSGGYVALLMVFMAQGTPAANILNLRYVAAEILLTLVGSFGLVTVAPLTAILAGRLMPGRVSAETRGSARTPAASTSVAVQGE